MQKRYEILTHNKFAATLPDVLAFPAIDAFLNLGHFLQHSCTTNLTGEA